jgi:hypothetical protein
MTTTIRTVAGWGFAPPPRRDPQAQGEFPTLGSEAEGCGGDGGSPHASARIVSIDVARRWRWWGATSSPRMTSPAAGTSASWPRPVFASGGCALGPTGSSGRRRRPDGAPGAVAVVVTYEVLEPWSTLQLP